MKKNYVIYSEQYYTTCKSLVTLGMFTCAQKRPTLSAMSKPRSAKTKSTGKSLLRIPQDSVVHLLLIIPPHPCEIKDIEAFRGISIKKLHSIELLVP